MRGGTLYQRARGLSPGAQRRRNPPPRPDLRPRRGGARGPGRRPGAALPRGGRRQTLRAPMVTLRAPLTSMRKRWARSAGPAAPAHDGGSGAWVCARGTTAGSTAPPKPPEAPNAAVGWWCMTIVSSETRAPQTSRSMVNVVHRHPARGFGGRGTPGVPARGTPRSAVETLPREEQRMRPRWSRGGGGTQGRQQPPFRASWRHPSRQGGARAGGLTSADVRRQKKRL